MTPKDYYHPILELFLFMYSPPTSSANLRRSLRKANFSLLNQLIIAIDWSILYNTNDINIAVNFFYNTLNSLFDVSIPNSVAKSV